MTVNKLQNYLLIAFLSTGVLANFSGPHYINNAFMLFFIVSSFLTKSTRPNSKIFHMYFIIGSVSVLNQMVFMSYGAYVFNSHHLTVPIIMLLLYSVNRIKLNYSYETFVLFNVFPIILLFLLGGFETLGGRIHTEYITANLKEIMIFFGFMVSANNILQKKALLVSAPILVFSGLFLILSGSRQNIILLLIGSLLLLYPVMKNKNYFKKYRLLKKILLTIVIFIGMSIVVNKGIHQLSERFGNMQKVEAQLRGEETEYSMLERLNFINTSLVIITKGYITGVGEGNIKYALEAYGNKEYKVTNNPHSVIAQFVFSAGIIGLLVLILLLFRMMKLFWINKKYRFQYGYIFIYFSLAIFTIPLMTIKVFWVLLIILERQIMKESKV